MCLTLRSSETRVKALAALLEQLAKVVDGEFWANRFGCDDHQ